MNKKIVIPALLIALAGGVAFVSVRQVMAETSNGNYPPIVQKLVQKFGLKEADVKAVFDEERRERQAGMEVKFEERLAQLVKDGKITETQMQLILAKHKEIQASNQAKPENWMSMTMEERRAWMDNKKAEMEKWAKDNGIDVQYLFGLGPGMGRGIGRRHF